jgi:hypothetical protein
VWYAPFVMLHWFRTTPDRDKYMLVGISNEEEEAPGVLMTIQCEVLDYGPPAMEYTETQAQQLALFNYIPEKVISLEEVVVPSLFYARARPDWTEGTWKHVPVSGVATDQCEESTPTTDA